MPFKNACFLSYRHAQFRLMRNFVEQFHDALASELEPLTDLPVYQDSIRLQGGDVFNEHLPRNLCESVCMVMIYTPTYFSPDHLYCAREYAAMKDLEKMRLSGLRDRSHGLIIPVVLRDFDRLPDEIRSVRQVHQLDQFGLASVSLTKIKGYDVRIRSLAAYVAERCRDLEHVEPNCEGFEMPGDDAVMPLVRQLKQPALGLPGRGVADA
jgi:hypothetical protein